MLGPIPEDPRVGPDRRNLPKGKQPPKCERVLRRRELHVPRTFAGLHILKDDKTAPEHAQTPSGLVS
jgi:hypothetical protein